jgi:hypothetical protein
MMIAVKSNPANVSFFIMKIFYKIFAVQNYNKKMIYARTRVFFRVYLLHMSKKCSTFAPSLTKKDSI